MIASSIIVRRPLHQSCSCPSGRAAALPWLERRAAELQASGWRGIDQHDDDERAALLEVASVGGAA